MNQNIIVKLADAIPRKQLAPLVKVGSPIILLSDGFTVGTVSGGKLESSILADAQAALDKPELYRIITI